MQGCHLLVATPGRLHDLLQDEESGIDAPNLKALVLDEADRMLDVGFAAELENILSFLPNRSEVPRQTLLYSATMPKNVVGLARKFIDPSNFEFVQTIRADEAPTHERVPQFIVPCKSFANLAPTLLELVRREVKNGGERPFKAIVFLPTTASVVAYSSLFYRIRYKDDHIPMIWDIHSKLSQSTRTRNATDFRNAASGILFSSDVTARGMDFPNVTHVIQIHLPNDREHYIHRIGRTGRAGKEGQAWLLVADSEVSAARERLPGLPIQRATGLQSPAIEAHEVSDDLPETFQEVLRAARRTPTDVLVSMYSTLAMAIKGVHKDSLVNDLNHMAKMSFGMEEPPTVTESVARNLGYPGGLRYEHSRSGGRYSRGDRMGGGRMDSRGGSRRPMDSFAALEQSGERNDRRGGRRREAASF